MPTDSLNLGTIVGFIFGFARFSGDSLRRLPRPQVRQERG